jgi:hypothetical protein
MATILETQTTKHMRPVAVANELFFLWLPASSADAIMHLDSFAYR